MGEEMTRGQAISRISIWLRYTGMPYFTDEDKDAMKVAIDALSVESRAGRARWVPVRSADELPKNCTLWVTVDQEGARFVEELHWDMTEWSDNFLARNVVAYMDFYKPEPYFGAKMEG